MHITSVSLAQESWHCKAKANIVLAGIGTYVQDSKLTKTGHLSKIKSAYAKVKDQAVGTSFDSHVQGGYKFLMQYYSEGDDLYFFGFSRGAYIARFLAQMLDAVGLLSAGNEEMFRFAWKAFSQWQTRLDTTKEQKQKKHETYRFLKAFRETFSRPVSRVRFMGLFDTVNSVPRFEVAWMQRAKFPYAAKSSARVIRHAVSVDERRAKFRQYLISERPPQSEHKGHLHNLAHPHIYPHLDEKGHPHLLEETNGDSHKQSEPRPGALPRADTFGARFAPKQRRASVMPHPTHAHPQQSAPSPIQDDEHSLAVTGTASATASQLSLNSLEIVHERSQATPQLHAAPSDPAGNKVSTPVEDAGQDIKEVWFPGCHADIGGGWPLQPGEETSLSHAPLLWILREARRAGLPCDDDALLAAGYLLDDEFAASDEVMSRANMFFDASSTPASPAPPAPPAPTIELDGQALPPSPPPQPSTPTENAAAYRKRVLNTLHAGATQGRMHDSLAFGQGTPPGGVIWWRFMEHLPFRRMDLRPDGTWAPIRWPLPRGETRDVPKYAVVHNTVLKRMEADPSYRPGKPILSHSSPVVLANSCLQEI